MPRESLDSPPSQSTAYAAGGWLPGLKRTHKLFPLSSIGLERLADGTDCYTMFGALSSGSALSDVVFEIELLADNVIKATEAYENHLAMPA